MSTKLPTNEALALGLYSAIDAESMKYQWREIGEGVWVDTDDVDWILYCEKSPTHDTRVIEKD